MIVAPGLLARLGNDRAGEYSTQAALTGIYPIKVVEQVADYLNREKTNRENIGKEDVIDSSEGYLVSTKDFNLGKLTAKEAEQAGLERLTVKEPEINSSYQKSAAESIERPKNINFIDRPYDSYTEPKTKKKRLEWDLFDGNFSFESAPSYANLEEKPLFEMRNPCENESSIGLKGWVKNKTYKEIRKLVKKQWRGQFEESNLPYSEFEKRMAQINNIGRNPLGLEESSVLYSNDSLKENIFQKDYHEGERDISLFTVGPISLTDSGSVRLNFGSLTHPDAEEFFEIGEKTEHKPFLATKRQTISTDFSLSLDRESIVDRCSFALDIDFLTSVLGRKMASAGVEVQYDLNNREASAFFNFVMKSWK